MTRRRLLRTHIRQVAIRAFACLLKLREFVLNRDDLRVGYFLVVRVARRTTGNRHIGRKTAQGAGSRNVDVARRALDHMTTLAAFMAEHRGLTHRRTDR